MPFELVTHVQKDLLLINIYGGIFKEHHKRSTFLYFLTFPTPQAMASTIATPFNDSADITNFVISEGNGVKGLSEMGLKSLPQRFIQPLKERISFSDIMPHESIPVIDMSNWNDPKVAESICDAAETWGFFQIINHGVPIEALENVKDATRLFFGLPAEEKKKFLKENSPSNNVRFGTSFTPEAEKALEWKDYLSLFYVSEDEASALWPPVCK